MILEKGTIFNGDIKANIQLRRGENRHKRFISYRAKRLTSTQRGIQNNVVRYNNAQLYIRHARTIITIANCHTRVRPTMLV